MGLFRKYLEEDISYILSSQRNVSSAKLLGIVKDSDTEMFNNIESALNARALNDALTELLDINNYPSKNLKELRGVFAKHFYNAEKIAIIHDIISGKRKTLAVKEGSYDIKDIAAFFRDIPLPFFTELAGISGVDQRGSAIGKGEFLLGLFTDLSNTTSGGDLQTPRGLAVEVKGPDGRMKSQRPPKGHIKTIKDLAKAYSSSAEAKEKVLNFSKTISHTFFLNANLFNKETAEILDDNRAVSQIISALLSYDISYKVSSRDIASFRDAFKSTNKMIAFLVSVHLFAYVKEEKLAKVIFFKDKSNYTAFVVTNTSGLNSIADVYNTMSKLSHGGLSGIGRDDRSAAFGPKIR